METQLCYKHGCDRKLSHMEKDGINLFNSNPHYNKLATIMENPEFDKFYQEYFCQENIDTILMFMAIYNRIKQETNDSLNAYQKLTILDNMIRDSKTRENLSRTFDNWLKKSKTHTQLIKN